MEEVIVVTPATLTLSKFVCPSTSKSPLASILLEKVVTPVITIPLFSARSLVEPPVCKSIVSVPNCNLVLVSEL